MTPFRSDSDSAIPSLFALLPSKKMNPINSIYSSRILMPTPPLPERVATILATARIRAFLGKGWPHKRLKHWFADLVLTIPRSLFSRL